jgi:lambda repressor-like predicted transcriptional regulator
VKEALKRVERAANKRDRVQVALRAAILAAHQQGASLRAIAKAAGLSHIHIRRIVLAQTAADDERTTGN